jgi:FkbM family methyltransferase
MKTKTKKYEIEPGCVVDFCYYEGKAIASNIEENTLWEKLDSEFFIKKIKNIDMFSTFTGEDFVFLDIGGHIGYYSVLCAALCKNATIHIFEPFEKNIEMIKKNLSPFKNCFIHHCALSDKEEECDFYISDKDFACNTLDFDFCGLNDLFSKTKTKTKKLSSFDIDFDKIKFVKIDIEGHELPVLKECSHLFPLKTHLIIENISSKRPKNTIEFRALGIHPLGGSLYIRND